VTTVTGPAVSRKLAINRLRERRPAEPAVIDRFLARHDVPIVEGARCTFLYRGEADEVSLVHRAVGLPEHDRDRVAALVAQPPASVEAGLGSDHHLQSRDPRR